MYTLYEVQKVKDVLMLRWVSDTPARNMVEAESIFETSMVPGLEYMIVIKK